MTEHFTPYTVVLRQAGRLVSRRSNFMRLRIILFMILLQVLMPGKSLAQTFKLTVDKVEATVAKISRDKIKEDCLIEALRKVRDLYLSDKLESLKVELTTDHEAVRELLNKPHAILPIDSKVSLAITLIKDGNVIVPLEGNWKPGETYKWFSASGKSTGISSCTQ